MILLISHRTTYRYDGNIHGASHMEARLRPLTIPGVQRCLEFSLTTDPPAAIFQHDLADQMGSVSHFALRNQPHDRLDIQAESMVETLVANPFLDVDFGADDWSVLEQEDLKNSMPEWLAPTAMTPQRDEWRGPARNGGVFQYGLDLMNEIFTSFEYAPGTTDVDTPLEQFVATRRGVCQDYAHYMLSVARSQGIPARYISGYVYGGADELVQGGDAMHAWAELYIPAIGLWKGFDPTNNLVVADHHVKVAVGRDYADVPPTRGILRGAAGFALPKSSTLEVSVHLRRPAEEPAPAILHQQQSQ